MHIEFMGERLQQILRDYTIKTGNEGKARLSLAVGKSVATIDRWLRDGVPDEHDAYKLAVVAGCTDDEALALARKTSKATKAG